VGVVAGRFSIGRPRGRTNLVTNPSVEIATTGYTGIGAGGISRVTTYAYHGAYSLAVTPAGAATDGVYYGTVSLTSGTTYAASVKFYAPNAAGKLYRLSFATTAGALLQSVEFRATGFWQWVSVLWTETSTSTRRIYITNAAAQTPVFYLDGLQVEACETGNYWPTTYIDGDQQGLLGAVELPPYYWTGTPHASTSVRSGQTRAGGRVVPLERYGLHVTSAQGLGLAPVQPITTPFAQLDGSQFLDIRKQGRPVTLAGRWGALTPAAKERQIAALAADLDRDLIATRQPLTILAEPMQGGKPLRAPIAIPGLSYVEGLTGDLTGLPTEESIIAFTQYQPRIAAGENGSALDVQDVLSNRPFLQRSIDGQWRSLGTPYIDTGTVYTVLGAPSGRIYVGGGTLTMSDASTFPGIAQWDGSAWSGLGTGMSGGDGTVRCLAVGPDGRIYAGGGFTSAGGTGANRIAVWNGSAWAALGTGLNSNCLGIAFGLDGTLYATGTFTTAGGGAATGIAQWDGSTWSAVGSGFDASGTAIALGPDGRIYAGGTFTTAGGNPAALIAVWDGSAWAALGSGLTPGQVGALAFGPDGRLYVGGSFTTAGGVAANRIAVWNGTQWAALGGGLTAAGGEIVNAIAVSPLTGTLYAGGTFTAADGVPAGGFARWNGSSWSPGDLLNSTLAVNALSALPDGSLLLGRSITGGETTPVAAPTTVTVAGTAAAYPRVTITGPTAGSGTVWYLANEANDAFVSLNLAVLAGETVILDFRPGTLSVMTLAGGNRLGSVLPGSNMAGFILQPGANSLFLLCDDSTMTATMTWANDLASLTDGWLR
jgi:hypothetical protein